MNSFGSGRAMSSKRLSMTIPALITTSLVLLLLFRFHGAAIPRISTSFSLPEPALSTSLLSQPSCGANGNVFSASRWNAAQEKHKHLKDDKFTIAMLTYQRPKELEQTLKALTENNVPSLEEIVVIWNEIDKPMPPSWTSQHGIPVRYRLSQRNSMNMKFWPDPEYRTKAILLHDDDVYLQPEDMEFGFQVWRQFGQNRMTGVLARCVERKDGKWTYSFCPNADKKDQQPYQLVLSNLAFLHISFMDYFASDDKTMTAIRDHIDAVFNCDDLAINYITSMITCKGPLQIVGSQDYVTYNPSVGISTDPKHMEKRDVCLNLFEEMMGFMPLMNQTGRVVRGVAPH